MATPKTSSPTSRRIAASILRPFARAFLRSAYRLRVHGLEHVPAEGPAIVVCNHVSFHDWLFVAASLPRVPRFVMHQHHFHMRSLRWFFSLFGVIPIAPQKQDPERLERAMDAIDEALAEGDLVAIFPEGNMTEDGEIHAFRPGVERIVLRRPVPVVPLAIRGLWGSFFSRAGGEPMKKLPRRVRARVELCAGPPVAPSGVTAPALRACIGALRGAAR